MNVQELPDSTLVELVPGAASQQLSAALHAAASGKPLFFWNIIRGASRSGRIFSTGRLPGSVEVLSFSYDVMAKEFQKLLGEARYDPKEAPLPTAEKGWEVRQALSGGQPVVIVWAAWVG